MSAVSTPSVVVLDAEALARIVDGAVSRALATAAETAATVPDSEGGPSILTQAQLADLLGVSARDLRRRILDGRVPAGVLIGPRSRRWVRADVLAWLRAGAPKSIPSARRRTG